MKLQQTFRGIHFHLGAKHPTKRGLAIAREEIHPALVLPRNKALEKAENYSGKTRDWVSSDGAKRPRVVDGWRLSLQSVLLIAIVVVSRVVPHWPNVTPTTATALVSGAVLPMPWALLVPLLAMVASDMVIGFDMVSITASVYLSFALTVGLGVWLRTKRNPGRIILTTLASALLFYFITNAAVWWYSGMYARTLDGLLYSYILALPFLRNSLFGDLLYTSVFFLALQYVPMLYHYLRSLREQNIPVSQQVQK